MQSNKYYAVRVGKQTGVFRTWVECKANTFGYPNASFKVFPTFEEASKFLDHQVVEIPLNACKIYIDGSHQRSKNYLGIGAWARWNEQEYQLSMRVDRSVLDTYGVPKETECSNPSAEIIALAEMLKKFENRKLEVPIVFYSDYIGVRSWMDGSFKTNEVHTTKIVSCAKSSLEKIEGKVIVDWVKGHSKNEGNDNADEMATCHEEIDTFNDLIEIISKPKV